MTFLTQFLCENSLKISFISFVSFHVLTYLYKALLILYAF